MTLGGGLLEASGGIGESPDAPMLPCGHRSPPTVKYRTRPAMRKGHVRKVFVEILIECSWCHGRVPVELSAWR